MKKLSNTLKSFEKWLEKGTNPWKHHGNPSALSTDEIAYKIQVLRSMW